MSDEDWASRRTEAARAHERALHARKEAEHDRARALLRRFTTAALRAGLPAEPLTVRGYGGRGTARSQVSGWYLRQDRAAGVGTDGEFYILTAPLRVVDRLRGVTLQPAPPPLVLGAGGKDGDSIDLPDALERLLPGWDAQPPGEPPDPPYRPETRE